jgi:hypothetical protein
MLMVDPEYPDLIYASIPQKSPIAIVDQRNNIKIRTPIEKRLIKDTRLSVSTKAGKLLAILFIGTPYAIKAAIKAGQYAIFKNENKRHNKLILENDECDDNM